MKTFTALVLATLLLAWSPFARALTCGDTITASVTLTADLHCTTGWVALYVPTGGVTIRLNGHTLSGTSALQGIQVLNASRVRIVGPGRITGFWVGVNGTRADYMTVQGVDFDDTGAGVIGSDTLAATVRDNDFRNLRGWGVYLMAYTGGRTTLGAHAILDNLVLESVAGIAICGHPNSDNLIKGNTLQGLSDYGIHLYDGTSANQVLQNTLLKMASTSIVLRGTRKNTISGNLIDYGHSGIAMTPQFTGSCSTGPYATPEVRDNRIEGNGIFNQSAAIILGLGIDKNPQVLKNRINGNKLYDNGTGLYFLEDSYANDATGNAYTGTVTPVVDHGHSNSY